MNRWISTSPVIEWYRELFRKSPWWSVISPREQRISGSRVTGIALHPAGICDIFIQLKKDLENQNELLTKYSSQASISDKLIKSRYNINKNPGELINILI